MDADIPTEQEVEDTIRILEIEPMEADQMRAYYARERRYAAMRFPVLWGIVGGLLLVAALAYLVLAISPKFGH